MAQANTVKFEIIVKNKKTIIEIDVNSKTSQLFELLEKEHQIIADKIIAKGKALQPSKGEKTLSSVGIKPNSKPIKVFIKLAKNKKVTSPNNNSNLTITSPESTNSTNSSSNISSSDIKPFSLFGFESSQSSSDSSVNTNNNNNNNNNDEQKIDNSVDDAINRQKTLEEIQAAATKLAARANDGFNWHSEYYLELTDQNGNAVRLPEETRQALTTALTLHQKGQKYVKDKNYKDALFLFELAHESFSKVDVKWRNIVDNYPILCLDIVWMHYLLKDEKNLMQAGRYLQSAENGFEKAYGKNKERLNALRKGGFTPELSLYVRLNILRSIQALYTNDINNAQNYLLLAQMDSRKLTISDESIAQLQAFGFSLKEAKRGLRVSRNNVNRASEYILNKRDERQQQAAIERQRLIDREEQRKYGLTKSGKFIDLKLLNQLKNMGIVTEIAVEALKQTDNTQAALDIVLNQTKREELEQTVYKRAMKKQHQGQIDQLMDISVDQDEAKCRAALLLSFNKINDAINMILADPPSNDLQHTWNALLIYVAKKNERLEKLRKEREYQRQLAEAMKQSNPDNNDNNNNNNNDNTNDNANDNNNDIDMTTGNTNNNSNANNDNDIDIDMNTKNNNNNNENENDNEDIKNDVIESAIENEKVSAFPNPHLPENINNDGVNINDIDIIDDFQDIQYKAANEDDEKIDQHIIDDFEDDPDAYLDLDMDAEIEALKSVQAMIQSLNVANQQSKQ